MRGFPPPRRPSIVPKPIAHLPPADTHPEHLLAPVPGPRRFTPPWSDNGAVSHEPARYWAFISYSHRDKRWGDWLHRSLETYRVPRRLEGKPSRDGVVPAGCFRSSATGRNCPSRRTSDRTSTRRLRESRYLIVICSPRAAASRWVNEEVLYFKRLGRADRILALIVDGEPNATDGKPGVPAEDECFPEAMRFHIGEAGELSRSGPSRSRPMHGTEEAGQRAGSSCWRGCSASITTR